MNYGHGVHGAPLGASGIEESISEAYPRASKRNLSYPTPGASAPREETEFDRLLYGTAEINQRLAIVQARLHSLLGRAYGTGETAEGADRAAPPGGKVHQLKDGVATSFRTLAGIEEAVTVLEGVI